MIYNVGIERTFPVGKEIVDFEVLVEDADVLMAMPEDDDTYEGLEIHKKQYAVELAMNKFFRQGYVFSPGGSLKVVYVESLED